MGGWAADSSAPPNKFFRVLPASVGLLIGLMPTPGPPSLTPMEKLIGRNTSVCLTDMKAPWEKVIQKENASTENLLQRSAFPLSYFQ
jgi:hypothetical protein